MMIAMLFLAVAALLAFAMVSSWRDPKNWIADSESGTLRFGAWTELSAFGVLLAIVALCSAMFIG